MDIKVMSEEIIKPSSPTPNHLRRLQTSLFDVVNSPTLMPLIFFYSKTNDANLCTNQVLDRLKRSLPNTLSLYYPLSGRISDPNNFICNDEGVPYVQTVVNKPLEDVVHKAEVCDLDKLLPSYGQQGFTTLLLAIQVNSFACGGLAIGVKINHAISDGYSLLMFIKTWASMANGKDHQQHIAYPYFGISKLFPSLPITKKGNQNNDQIKHRPVTKWFTFEEAKINALRSKLFPNNISSSSSNKIGVYSLAMVLSAFIWSRIKLACYNQDKNIPHYVFQTVHLRPRLGVPSENSYYFGNVLVNAIAKLTENSLVAAQKYSSESLMYDFLDQMNKSIAIINGDNSFIREMQEGKQNLRFVMDHFEKECNEEIVALGFSNGRSLPVYESDFGWGKPVWVTSATLMFKNLIILIPASPTTKDIVAYINLSFEDMENLESDTQFKSFVSKVLTAQTKSKSRL